MRPARTAPLRRVLTVVMEVALLLGTGAPAGAQSAEPSGPPPSPATIVVTTPILGSIVRELVGDRALISVLMDGSVDPHEWAPSARDLEMVYGADLVVANGLGLEAGLQDALDQAAAGGVPVFEATDHITVRSVGAAGQLEDAAAADGRDASPRPGAADPHFWTDPVTMISVVEALGDVLADLGIDVADRQADLVARLTQLDAEVRTRLESIPTAARTLVTGHESMGYFADRYGFELVGAVIPGLSSQGEVSARAMADLAARIREAGTGVIFAEVGTPTSVAEAIAAETGARIVQLPTHQLPEDGSYLTFISRLADIVAESLS